MTEDSRRSVALSNAWADATDEDAGISSHAKCLALTLDEFLLAEGQTSGSFSDSKLQKAMFAGGDQAATRDDLDAARAELIERGLLRFEPGHVRPGITRGGHYELIFD